MPISMPSLPISAETTSDSPVHPTASTLREGDFVEVNLERGAALVKPKKLVDAHDILTSKEEKLVRKGEAQLKKVNYAAWEDVKKRLKL
jgi:hypothetical protein